MEIGDYVTVHKDVWLHAHRSAKDKGGPVLSIGDHCFIARRSHISAKNHIEIESNILLAASVLIQDHGHNFSNIDVPIGDQGTADGGTVRIGQGCWIGQGAAIICDSGELTLGRNCVVGANAVVTRSASPYSVLSGNPARIVKQFDTVKGVWVLGASRQVEAGPAKAPQVATEP
jgi:acetyltransferase-like isoleucine patch superfamily enzyme